MRTQPMKLIMQATDQADEESVDQAFLDDDEAPEQMSWDMGREHEGVYSMRPTEIPELPRSSLFAGDSGQMNFDDYVKLSRKAA